jgi:hypothetical protein
MSENLTSTPEVEQQAVPNNQIQGVNHAVDRNYFPTINMALGKPNVTLNFKYDAKNKKMYTQQADFWNPVNPTTQKKWDDYKKKYRKNPYEIAEQMVMEEYAKFPDGTFKYYISYMGFKRVQGADGVEYLVRTGFLHGISFMNMEWKHPKDNFDWHYEPIFDAKVGSAGTGYNPVYGEQVNSIKVYHTPWNPDTFDKSLRDIPFPKNTSIGLTLKVGVEGSMGTTPIPSLDAFRNKSFDDLYLYAKTGDRSYLELTKEEKDVVEAQTLKQSIKPKRK